MASSRTNPNATCSKKKPPAISPPNLEHELQSQTSQETGLSCQQYQGQGQRKEAQLGRAKPARRNRIVKRSPRRLRLDRSPADHHQETTTETGAVMHLECYIAPSAEEMQALIVKG
jgi:hypothetical protein